MERKGEDPFFFLLIHQKKKATKTQYTPNSVKMYLTGNWHPTTKTN